MNDCDFDSLLKHIMKTDLLENLMSAIIVGFRD